MNPIHRRDFLTGMAVAAVAPLAAEATPTGATEGTPALFVLADPRRVAARRFADEQAANGARTTPWQEDPYRWWHEGVAPALAELPGGQRVCIDGCTTWADYLVLVGEATRAGFRAVVAPHGKRARRENRAATLFTWRLVAMA
ncbi:MAG: hypothetical protein RJB26_612 [Pseudomonadota bacterium]